MKPRTLFEKVWDQHLVEAESENAPLEDVIHTIITRRLSKE